MFANFKNGVFALGIFFGCMITLFVYLGTSFFDFSTLDVFSTTIFGIFLGASISLLTTIYIRTKEIHEKSADIATVVQIRLTTNWHTLLIMSKTISAPRDKIYATESLKLLPVKFRWIIEFQPISDNIKLDFSKPEELAFLMRILPRDLKERAITIWREAAFIEGRYRELSAAIRGLLRKFGLPQEDILRRGVFEISIEEIDPLIREVKLLDAEATKLLRQIESISIQHFDLLDALQNSLQAELGVKANYIHIQKNDADST